MCFNLTACSVFPSRESVSWTRFGFSRCEVCRRGSNPGESVLWKSGRSDINRSDVDTCEKLLVPLDGEGNSKHQIGSSTMVSILVLDRTNSGSCSEIWLRSNVCDVTEPDPDLVSFFFFFFSIYYLLSFFTITLVKSKQWTTELS